jgi:hypothetical protein
MLDAPQVVHEQLYCPNCCRRQEVVPEPTGSYRCTVCKHEVEVPADPEACPRSPDGKHNPLCTLGDWRCSRCNASVEPPADAGIIYLGGAR